MFSLLTKNKFYIVSEYKNGFFDNLHIFRLYMLGALSSYSNVFIFSPINDIIFNKNKFMIKFIYPNKYNAYFKIYNIFSFSRQDLSIYDDQHQIDISSSLFFEIGNLSLKDLISYIIQKNKSLRYNKGIGTFDSKVSVFSPYWFSMFSNIIFGISNINLNATNYNIENRRIDLEYYLIRQNIINAFNNFKKYVENHDLTNANNKKLYNNFIENIEKLIFLSLERKIQDMVVSFHLNKRTKNLSSILCSLNPTFNFMFFYDKHRKDFILLFDISFNIIHHHLTRRDRFYNNVLMDMRFNILRTGYDVNILAYMEFYPDSTYNNIELNVLLDDNNNIKDIYKQSRDYKTYKRIIVDEHINTYKDFLRHIDKSMYLVYKKSKISLLNGSIAIQSNLFQ
ncbi:MAG: hypothetical protein QXF12_03205 [Candidatus Aenigmatarchaeota archaeon]